MKMESNGAFTFGIRREKAIDEDQFLKHRSVFGDFSEDFGDDDVLVPLEYEQTSDQWISSRTLKKYRLTMIDLLNKGFVTDPDPTEAASLKLTADDLDEFEAGLNRAIQMYSRRINWLLQGTRKVFGVVRGCKPAIILDVSDNNCHYGRLAHLKESLTNLLEEQIANRAGLYLMAFGSTVNELWPQVERLNQIRIQEAVDWVHTLSPLGTGNLLNALKHVCTMAGDFDCILLVLGSAPNQHTRTILEYMQQCFVGERCPVDTVSYLCELPEVCDLLRGLSEEGGARGRYHVCVDSRQDLGRVYEGTDIARLIREIEQAQEVLERVDSLRQGVITETLAEVIQQLSLEVDKLPQSYFLPKPLDHESKLVIVTPAFQPRTSADWLKQHGLKSKGLTLYQVLSPNAYSNLTQYVSVLRRRVCSRTYRSVMLPVTWHDGSVKHAHVDAPTLEEYQRELGRVCRLYEERIQWLVQGSRRQWGTVTESNVILMLDLCAANSNYLVQIQQCARAVLEQQMGNKDYFNIICYGSDCQAWRGHLVPASDSHLQAAWAWLLQQQCHGTRNFLEAFRVAVETDTTSMTYPDVDGIYVFTSGVPDQSVEYILPFVEQTCVLRGIRVHCVLYIVEDSNTNPSTITTSSYTSTSYTSAARQPTGRYASIKETCDTLRCLSHATGGRFHWFSDTSVLESDDILAISAQVERAVDYNKKSIDLIEQVKAKYKCSGDTGVGDLEAVDSSDHTRELTTSNPTTWIPTRDTMTSRLRKEFTDQKLESDSVQSLPWREQQDHVRRHRRGRLKSTSLNSSSMGKLTRGGGSKQWMSCERAGSSKLPHLSEPFLPPQDSHPVVMSSEQWLRTYSLSALRLDLNRIVYGPRCAGSAVATGRGAGNRRYVGARYCKLLPLIKLRGVDHHLQMSREELSTYVEYVSRCQRRYIQRMRWIVTGDDRYIFGGVIRGKRVTFIIHSLAATQPDTVSHRLVTGLEHLIWNQLRERTISFNVMTLTEADYTVWCPHPVPPTFTNCEDACAFLTTYWQRGADTRGRSVTTDTGTTPPLIKALQHVMSPSTDTAEGEEESCDNVYVVMSGSDVGGGCDVTDSGIATLLSSRADASLTTHGGAALMLHTVSYCSSDVEDGNDALAAATSVSAMRQLAHRCHGTHYHCTGSNLLLLTVIQHLQEPGAITSTQQLQRAIDLELPPELQSSDLKPLLSEILKSNRYISKAKHYRSLHESLPKAKDVLGATKRSEKARAESSSGSVLASTV